MKAYRAKSKNAFTLVESLAVVALIGLTLMVSQRQLFTKFTHKSFTVQANKLVSALQDAAFSAGKSDRRYEIIIDIVEQSFTLRQITSPDLDQITQEEIIETHFFDDNCYVDYIVFDDLITTDDQHLQAKFRVGKYGFQNGGNIVLLDKKQQPYTIIVNRLNRLIKLKQGDLPIALPKRSDEIFF